MAIHYTKRTLVIISLPIISRIPHLINCATKSNIITSGHPKPHLCFYTNSTIFHYSLFRERWISSDTRPTYFQYPSVQESAELSSDDFFNDSDDDQENSEENEVFRKVDSIKNISVQEGMIRLDECGFIPSPSVVQKLLYRVQNNWKAAFAVFRWAGLQSNYNHTVRVFHAMIFILGSHHKFKIAWGLIREMHERAMVTRHTLKIMTERYAAAESVRKAIKTFHAMEVFNLAADYSDFLYLLRVLCRYQYLEEAEELMHSNKMYFPLVTESFNVLLHGWGNILVDVYQVKRLWQDMYNLCITPDVSSYTTIIYCLSKAGKLYDVVRLYDEMKKKDFTPNLKVYNSVIYVLVKENCLKQALHLFNRVQEMGFSPNAETYVYLIYALCLSWDVKEAYSILDKMVQKGFTPTIRIYYSFFRFIKHGDAIFEFFGKMIKTGCAPNMEIFIMSIRRCCSWGEYENALRLWNAMEKHGYTSDHSACIILLDGFFLNGKPEEACKCYRKMKGEGFSLYPKVVRIFEAWIASRKYTPILLHHEMLKERFENRKKSTSM